MAGAECSPVPETYVGRGRARLCPSSRRLARAHFLTPHTRHPLRLAVGVLGTHRVVLLIHLTHYRVLAILGVDGKFSRRSAERSHPGS